MTLVQIKNPLSGFLELEADKPASDALIVRPSSHNSFTLCGYRVIYSTQPGFDGTSSEAMAWGTGLHKLLNNHIVWRDVAALTDTPEQALMVWAHEMEAKGEDIFAYAGRSFLLGKSREMLDAYHSWIERFWLPVGQHLDIVGVESTEIKPLGILPSGREAWVRGTADFVTEGHVFDWKSAGRGWKKGKAEATAVQPLTYSWLVSDKTDVTEATFVVFNRQDKSWSWDDTTFSVTPERMDLALRALWDMARSVDTGVAVATPMTTGGFGDGRGWHCSSKFCGAWNICPWKDLIPDGKSNTSRGEQKWE